MILNWPAVALVLGLVSILVFRRPLASLVERTEKVKDWLVAPKQPPLPEPTDQVLPTRNATIERRALDELTNGFNSQLLLLQEEAIRSDLTKHGLVAENAAEKVLLRHLAGTQIALQFERVYAVLYNSQLQALRWLNSQTVGATAKDLLTFYERAAATWPVIYDKTDFRAWLGFLASHGLVTESEESRDAHPSADPFGLQITVLGREFLAFLVNAGRADPTIG